MHGRIYQIADAPIQEADYLSLSNYDTEEVAPINADYVDSDPCPIDSIATLKLNLNKRCGSDNVLIENNSFILLEGFREAYFSAAFAKFHTALGMLVDYALEDFAAGKMRREMDMLKDAYDNAFGDYIWMYNSLMTRDEFIRNAKPGVRYYFGGTLDYHW